MSRDTLVVEGMGSEIPREIEGMRVCRWGKGDVMEEHFELIELVKLISVEGYGSKESIEQACHDWLEAKGW